MGYLLRRRAFMTTPLDESWNYEWEYTAGLLENNGWTKTTLGTTTSTMTSAGQRLTSSINSYVRLEHPSFAVVDVGVLEVVASVVYASGGNNDTGRGSQNMRLSISNGENGIQVYVNGDTSSNSIGIGLKLMDNNDPRLGTFLAPFESGSEHTIRLELNHNTGAVWLDRVLIRDNIDTSTILYCPASRIWSQNQVGNGSETIIKSVKIRKNRL